jgi:hypothetical protein
MRGGRTRISELPCHKLPQPMTAYARSTGDGFEQNFYNFLPAKTIACPNAFLFRSGNGSGMY